jgi:uncharacterized protein (TIGR02284 family)
MNHRYAIATLSELLAVTRDAQRGFSNCAQRAQEDSLRRGLYSRAARHAAAAVELSELLAQLGGNPLLPPRVQGARRAWLDANAPGRTDEVLLLDCQQGQDHVLEIYRNALDDHLPDFVAQVVLRQFEGMVSDHDQIRMLCEPPPGGVSVVSAGGQLQQ